jgi:hypothetical protein
MKCIRILHFIGTVLLGEVTVAQIVKRYGFCGTQRFITEFERTRCHNLSWARWIHLKSQTLFIYIPPTPVSPKWSFPFRFPDPKPYSHFLFPPRVSHAQLIPFCFIWSLSYWLKSSNCGAPHYARFSIFLISFCLFLLLLFRRHNVGMNIPQFTRTICFGHHPVHSVFTIPFLLSAVPPYTGQLCVCSTGGLLFIVSLMLKS